MAHILISSIFMYMLMDVLVCSYYCWKTPTAQPLARPCFIAFHKPLSTFAIPLRQSHLTLKKPEKKATLLAYSLNI